MILRINLNLDEVRQKILLNNLRNQTHLKNYVTGGKSLNL